MRFQVGRSPSASGKGTVEPAGLSPSHGRLDKFGVLQPQDVILGLFDEYVGLDERAWSGGLVQLLGDLGFSDASSRIALNRVIARGLLAPAKQGRFVFYTITPRLDVMHGEWRRQTSLQVSHLKWTGQWTIVWYSIPEELRLQRGQFGRGLDLRGFGAIQDGTWIAPGDQSPDVTVLAQRLGLQDHLVTFVGALAKDVDVRATVDRAWQIPHLKKMYDVFVTEFGPLADQRRIAELSPAESFVIRTRLIEMFRQTTMYDPRIPDEVLGLKWKRRDAVQLFQVLRTGLKAAASSYFRSVAVSKAVTG